MSLAAFTTDADLPTRLDAEDTLGDLRRRFRIPAHNHEHDAVYLCGNSLGLQPTDVRDAVNQELDDWAALGVEAHFHGRTPWYSYHEVFRECGARLVGARPGEVVMMNSLTVNLHLMLVSFFRPDGRRRKIVMDWPAFPSDIYALKTHLRTRGLDPDEDLIIWAPREGEQTVRLEDLETILKDQGDEIALVLCAGVNYYTGQVMPIERITTLAHDAGCIAGFDLAHAAGNVELSLHDWDVDFAVWCSYKYLNAGPGAIAGCFVHERLARCVDLPRYGGWWGNDPSTRFRMHLEPEFTARADADGWQISNPPILAMAPLRISLQIFDDVGMPALRQKSRELTGYMRYLIEAASHDWFEIITPPDAESQGCQLSILVHDRARERFTALEAQGFVGDYREPNVIRVAPVPLYNTFTDVYRFATTLMTQEMLT